MLDCLHFELWEVQTSMVERKSVNPYEPPLTDASLRRADRESSRSFNIRLVGHPTDEELRSCLSPHTGGKRSFSEVGLAFLLLFLVTPFFLAAIAASLPGLFAIFLGVFGVVFLACVVSGVHYRAGVLKNEFPQWDAGRARRVDADGVTLFEGDSWSLYRWEWFRHAIVSETAMLFVPELKSKFPVLIGASMVQSGDAGNVCQEWDVLSKLSVDLLKRGRAEYDEHLDESNPPRKQSHLELICDRNRGRTVTVDAGAVPFSGDVLTRDLEHEAFADIGWQRTRRSRFVVALLMIFGGLMFGGISDLWLGDFWVLLLVYSLFILVWMIMAKTKPVAATQRRHYFQLGYATDERLVLDFGINVGSFAWRDIEVLATADDFLAVKAGRLGQTVVLRPDMFQDAEQWKRIFAAAMPHAKAATV